MSGDADDPPKPTQRIEILRGGRVGRALLIEALSRAAVAQGVDPRYAGGIDRAVERPPEIEPPMPEAHYGVSARNARRLAKKRRKK